jgi:hypothetical protein
VLLKMLMLQKRVSRARIELLVVLICSGFTVRISRRDALHIPVFPGIPHARSVEPISCESRI